MKCKAKIKCDCCGKAFEVEYDDDTDTENDAAFDHSCQDCGMVLCLRCEKSHEDLNEADVLEDLEEELIEYDEEGDNQ